MKPLLTSSRARTFRECQRKHRFAYSEGYRPVHEPEYLYFGSLIHLGLEAYWHAIGSDADEAQVIANVLRDIHGKARDDFEQVRAEVLLVGYVLHWFATDSRRYITIAVEPTFRAPLMSHEDIEVTHDEWDLGGKVDAIAQDTDAGRVVVIEHKTTNQAIESDGDAYWSTLSLDHQISQYVIGAESLGYAVDEILYDVIRKPGQSPLKATPAASRKYKKDGTLYANQRQHDETPEEYRNRLEDAISSSMDHYYQRRIIPRTGAQIVDFLEDAWATAEALSWGERRGIAPRNPEACHRFGTCSYWLACSTGTHPSDHMDTYYRTDNVNPELEGSE